MNEYIVKLDTRDGIILYAQKIVLIARFNRLNKDISIKYKKFAKDINAVYV